MAEPRPAPEREPGVGLPAHMPRAQITGLVLAGGQGRRMGGLDKGLQTLQGQALAERALQRLAPQVGPLAINANRHTDRYANFGVPVWPDLAGGYPGPLAGFLSGLHHGHTRWLVTVPCDSPCFPLDLVARLAQALATEQAELAMAFSRGADGQPQAEPVFCLLDTGLRPSLQAALDQGQHQVLRWARQQRLAEVLFEEAGAFVNTNTLDELQALQRPAPPAA